MKHVILAIGLSLGICGCPSQETASPDGGVDPNAKAAWRVVLDETALDRAVLSIWGTRSTDVFAVGGPLGNEGRSSLALHFDGSTWTTIPTGGPETFWWVYGSTSSDVWMVGESGRIAHYDGHDVVEHSSGTTATLWGVWAAGPSDAWAVGGSPEKGSSAPNDVVLHWDGHAWSKVTLPGTPLGRSLFKVWGTSSTNLYIVGEYGTVWHRTDHGFTLESDPPIAQGTLFTVHGCSANDVYAVGGLDVLRRDEKGWSKLSPPLTNLVNGVSCGAPGHAAIVGFGGLKQRLEGGTWYDDFLADPHGDLHATWTDETGSVWAVGGDFLSKPKPMQPRAGVIARYGRGSVASDLHN